MKKRTIILIAALLVLVNIGLFVTIYNMLNPTNKLLHDEMQAMQHEIETFSFKDMFLQKLGVQDEDTEQLAEADQVSKENTNTVPKAAAAEHVEMELSQMENVCTIEEWNLSFQLPEDSAQYDIKVNSDLVTIEKNLQVYAYILRYPEGVEPSIEGKWNALGIYDGQSYYLRNGTSVTSKSENQATDTARQKVYNSILESYFFQDLHTNK